MKSTILSVGAFLAVCTATPAAAATFLLTFKSPQFGSAGPFTGSMTLTTADVAASDGSYAILGITGSGVYKTKTYTYAGPTLADGANNKLFADRTGRVFDVNGTSFSMTSGSSKISGRLFYYGSTTNAYMWAVGSDSGIMNSFAVQRLVGAVPEPGTWAMMLIGFGAIGGAARCRRRSTRINYAQLGPRGMGHRQVLRGTV